MHFVCDILSVFRHFEFSRTISYLGRMKLKTPLQLYLWLINMVVKMVVKTHLAISSRSLPDESSGDETYVAIELCRCCVIIYVPCAT